MQTITFQVQNIEELNVLLFLAEKIGIRQYSVHIGDSDETNTRDYYLSVIEKGGDTSYLGDPVKWQRKQRVDRDLPF